MDQQSPVTLANQRIPFATACRWAGIDVPGDVTEHGLKVWCPFSEFAHEDGGNEPALRIYPDHGWCFAEQQYFSPVGICAAVWDCTPEEAAREMLERAGIADPDYREQWQRLVDWSHPPDLDSLSAALHTWCAGTIPRWQERQYDTDVSAKLSACLGLLSKVSTEADCRMWLAGCKRAMVTFFEGERSAG